MEHRYISPLILIFILSGNTLIETKFCRSISIIHKHISILAKSFIKQQQQ